MARSPRSRSLIVHAWLEEGPGVGLRARITEVSDDDDHERDVATTAATVEAVCAAVRSWVSDLVTR
jgi:hypothetical protein